jgi:hypothetical protein
MRSRFLPAVLILLLAILITFITATITVRLYSSDSNGYLTETSYNYPSVQNTNIYGSSTHDPDGSGDSTGDGTTNDPPPEYCGDGSCNGDEECDTCPQDCGQCQPPPPYCGDDKCNNGETCNSCSKDCGDCPPPPPICGDGECNGDETCNSCSIDCDQCQTPPPPDDDDNYPLDDSDYPYDDGSYNEYDNTYDYQNQVTTYDDNDYLDTEDDYPDSTDDTHIGGLNYEVDRLANVDDTTMNCIKKRLNDTEYNRLRYGIPTTIKEKEELRDIQQKASICFATYKEIKNIEEATKHFGEMTVVADQCIVSKIGAEAFKEISTGVREPTENERRLSEECLVNEDMPEIQFQTGEQELGDEIQSCLILALGEDVYNNVKTGDSRLDLEDRDKVQRCFGASPEPFKELPVFKLPPEVESCLKENIWDERRELIKTGKLEPSSQEREFAKECFKELNEVQLKVLPAPPDLVPYLEVRPETVKISNIAQRIDAIDEQVNDRKLVLSGEGPPFSLVDIYLFSDPIVVTTKTDDNGNWVYELNHPLDEGGHVAYVTVKDETDSVVRSAVFDFQVLAAEQQLNQPFLEETQAQDTSYQFLNRVVLLIGVGVLIVAFGVGMFYKMRLEVRKDSSITNMLSDKGSGESSKDLGEGNSESESGPGSVD